MPAFDAIGMDAVAAGGTSVPSASTGVSADLSVAYAVGGTVSASLSAAYTVRAAVSNDLVAQYAVRAQTSTALSLAYALNGRVNADLVAGYSICSQVASDLPMAYSVEALVLSPASATLVIAYSVRTSVSSNLAIIFAVEPPVEYTRAPAGAPCRHGAPAYPDALRRVGLADAAISLDAARRAARVDGDDLDDEVWTAAVAYTEAAEHATSRAFVQQARRASFGAFSTEMILPKPPLISIMHVTYYDEEGVQRTLDPQDYFVDADAEPAVLTPAPGRTWPRTIDRAAAVEVKYLCGYGLTEASVPKPVKQYVLARIQQQFSPVSTAKDVNFDRLLDPYCVYL